MSYLLLPQKKRGRHNQTTDLASLRQQLARREEAQATLIRFQAESEHIANLASHEATALVGQTLHKDTINRRKVDRDVYQINKAIRTLELKEQKEAEAQAKAAEAAQTLLTARRQELFDREWAVITAKPVSLPLAAQGRGTSLLTL